MDIIEFMADSERRPPHNDLVYRERVDAVLVLLRALRRSYRTLVSALTDYCTESLPVLLCRHTKTKHQ